jgi:hypothetical protein
VQPRYCSPERSPIPCTNCAIDVLEHDEQTVVELVVFATVPLGDYLNN